EETASKEAAAEEDEIVIREEAAPLAAPALIEETGRWALANLVCALVSILTALGMIFTMKRKEDAKADLSKLLGMIPAALAITFVLLTESMSGTMVVADSYTVMMVIFPLVSLLIARLTRNENKGSDLI
ncbi:MAG: hypothetical protein IKE38_03455, partial [Erysipelotrichaceae bacterium]|nr:hypothetical protein [Erysipelotrichaceae bacterium]